MKNYHVEFDLAFRKNEDRGIFIAFEGIDASGKDTQAELITNFFKEKGRDVVLTKEPTREGVIGELVHEVLLGNAKVNPRALQYLFAADRVIHQEELILPSLKKGRVVISVRTFWSSVAYGILDKGLSYDKEEIDPMVVAHSILSFYHQFTIPDHIFYLDIPAEESLKRLGKRHKVRQKEIYEDKEKLEALKVGYDWLFEMFGENVVEIDGTKSVKDVNAEIIKHLKV